LCTFTVTKNVILTGTCAGKEVVSIFVEGDGHDSVGQVKRLLNSVTVVNVNVQVQNTWMIPAPVSTMFLRDIQLNGIQYQYYITWWWRQSCYD